ncbi:MAG: hypothetical protein V3W18_14115 [candidate division Zixibacteria bacterium]
MIITRITFAAALLVFLIPSPGMADIRLYFDRDNNTYNWVTSVNHSVTGKGISFKSYFDGHSNLIRGGFNRWQESASTGFNSEISIVNRLALAIDGGYTVNGLDKRRVKTTEMALGISYQPINKIRIRPLMRASNKKRSELETQLDENGLGYGLSADLNPSRIKGIMMESSLSYNMVNLSNIPWQQGEGQFNASAGFWRFDTVSVSLNGMEATKKYYSTGGKVEGIIKQIKQERNATFVVNMNLPSKFRMKIDGGAHLSRYLYRQNQTDNFAKTRRDNYGRGGDYRTSIFGNLGGIAHVSAIYLWSVANEDFQGQELDQDTEKGELYLHGNVILSPRDSVSADVMFGVTSYSNPNISTILDNRDQKTILVNGRYSHRFSEHFLLGATGGANSFHQIYQSGARSANNSRNDTYIFSPYAKWKLYDNLSIRQSFDIQANYITFDFDRKKVATKNRIFRRATTRTDLVLNVSKKLKISQGYLYRYEDYGLLIWDDGWQQSVSWDRKRNGLETRLDYQPVKQIKITPYFFWEKTGDYHRTVDPGTDMLDPVEIRYLKDEQVKMFFEFETTFTWSSNRRIVAGFSHRLRKFMDRSKETNDYIKISMEYMF